VTVEKVAVVFCGGALWSMVMMMVVVVIVVMFVVMFVVVVVAVVVVMVGTFNDYFGSVDRIIVLLFLYCITLTFPLLLLANARVVVKGTPGTMPFIQWQL
jgi:hypothetical protein